MVKKSVVIISYALGNDPSAVAQRINILYDTFVKNNIHVQAIYSNGSAKSSNDYNIKGFNTSKNYNIYLRFLNEIFVGIKALYYIFLLRKSDYFLVSSPPYFYGLFIVFILRLFKIRYWLDIRDNYPEALSDASIIKKNNLIYKFLSWVTNNNYKKATSVLVANPKFLVTFSSKKKYIFNNGFPEAFLNKRPKKYLNKTICIHGTFGYFQDIEFILKLNKKFIKENINLLLIGYGSKLEIIEKLNFPNISIFKNIPNNLCIDMVSKCHIGLSIRDSSNIGANAFPVKVWEYLGLNIPCVLFPSFKNLKQDIKKTNLLHFLPRRSELLAMKEINLIFKRYSKFFYIKNNSINKSLIQKYSREKESVKAYNFLIKNF